MTHIRLASRLARVTESASVAIADKAKSLQAQGRSIISLAAGEPDFDTPEPIKEAARLAMVEGKTKYTKVDGIDELKNAIAAKLLRDNGLTYERSQITVGCGAKQIIFNALLAIIDPGDEVIVPAPFWVSYPEMVLIAGGTPRIVSCSMADGFKLTPAALRAALTANTRMLMINSPSNPTGAVYSKEELQALGQVLRDYPDVIIMSDDIYEYIRWNGQPFDNLATACPSLKDRVLIVNGVSKSHAMTGWRIGYAAGPVKLIAAMRTMLSHSTSNPNSIAQYAAVKAMSMDASSMSEMIEAFSHRHTHVVGRLNAIDGVTCRKAEGAFYAFPDVSELCSRKGIANDVALAAALLDGPGIATVPGSAYGAPGHLRLSFAASIVELDHALDAFATFARDGC